MDDIGKISLVEVAIDARREAYSPYSGFSVGAALLAASGRIYKGCNIECAAFTASNCAERTAFFKAISCGEREFESIAIVGGRFGQEISTLCAPCGVCRQVMVEFCMPRDFKVLLARSASIRGIREFTLEQLLPVSFGPGDLA